MKKRGKNLLLLFVLAVVCVLCDTIQGKSSIPVTQEKDSISIGDRQEERNTLTAQEKDSVSIGDRQGERNTLAAQEKIEIPVTDRRKDNWQNHLGTIEEDANYAVQTEDTEVLAVSSEDKQYTVFTKQDNRKKLYIYNAESEKLDEIDVTTDLATTDAIMTLEWIGQNKVAVWLHVSPSWGCLNIYDVNGLQKLVEKNCSAYALAEELDTLVYVEPTIPFGAGKEKILNMDGAVLYQTAKNQVITSMDINDNSDIAIVVETMSEYYDTESTDLVVLQKKEKKYKIKEKIGLKVREGQEIEWMNNKKISYSTRQGSRETKTLTK